jgi:glutathionyl-hydroquinone reductase
MKISEVHALPARSPTAPAPADALHPPSAFRHQISRAPGARFQPQVGRYHLYVMYGCPWAHRTLIARALKGLEVAIPVTAVHHQLDEEIGWEFAPDRPDPLYGLRRLRDLYAMADPGYSGRITVPVLWDKHEQTIVNNESSEIIRMFNSEFNACAGRPKLDLYPEPWRPAIDHWNKRIQAHVNLGVYRAGFASTQAKYDAAVTALFDTLDAIEAHLATHRYLAGWQPSEADWRLFPSLIRLEWVYHGLFKCNLRRLVDYPRLLAYTRELFQWPGIAATVNERHIREGYHRSMTRLNPSGIVPRGPLVDFRAPHGRASLSG